MLCVTRVLEYFKNEIVHWKKLGLVSSPKKKGYDSTTHILDDSFLQVIF